MQQSNRTATANRRGLWAILVVAGLLAAIVTLIAWPESHAGALQAGAAILQFFSAALIVYLTYRLVESTDSYARSAQLQVTQMKDQLTELVTGRRASVRPYLRIDRVTASVQDTDTGASHCVIQVNLENMGAGPALAVRGELTGGWFAFDNWRNLVWIKTDEQQPQALPIGRLELYPGQVPPLEATLHLEYGDLADLRWSMDVTVRADASQGRIDFEVFHDTQEVKCLREFTLPGRKLRSDEDAEA